MSDEIIKYLASGGIGGLIGGVAIYVIMGFRREHREDMRLVLEATQKGNDWLVLIHSRLGSLGADSIPPPEPTPPPRVRHRPYRFRTAPAGVPVKPHDEGGDP